LIGINSRGNTAIYTHLVRILSQLRDSWAALKLSPAQTPVKTGLLPRNWQASA
jgi:hypothetical protein